MHRPRHRAAQPLCLCMVRTPPPWGDQGPPDTRATMCRHSPPLLSASLWHQGPMSSASPLSPNFTDWTCLPGQVGAHSISLAVSPACPQTCRPSSFTQPKASMRITAHQFHTHLSPESHLCKRECVECGSEGTRKRNQVSMGVGVGSSVCIFSNCPLIYNIIQYIHIFLS